MATGSDRHRARLVELAATLQFDDAINIQFTSGTTGMPKGATLTHHNILNNGHFVAEGMKLTEADRLCIPVPLYHCFGMVMGNLGCITHGAAMVYPGEGFDPFVVCLKRSRPNVAPRFFTACRPCSSPSSTIPNSSCFDLSSLRTGCMAGAPCPIEVMRRGIDDMHMRDVTIKRTA